MNHTNMFGILITGRLVSRELLFCLHSNLKWAWPLSLSCQLKTVLCCVWSLVRDITGVYPPLDTLCKLLSLPPMF